MLDEVLTIASEGNTCSDTSEAKPSREKQIKFWCGTHIIRNDAFDGNFKGFIEKQKQFIFGLEACPTTDRKHWQFYFETSNKSGIRFSKLHKDHPYTHFESCKGDKIQNFTYCSKSNEYTTNIIDIYMPEITHDMLHAWEKDIINIITNKADNRTIHWYWEPVGNIGKSTFSKFLSHFYGAVPLEGKKNDILYCASMFPSNIYIYDIERSLEDHLSYGAIEKIKNGFYMCAKYESKPVIRACPHLICFANFEPNYEKLSADRWHVVRLKP